MNDLHESREQDSQADGLPSSTGEASPQGGTTSVESKPHADWLTTAGRMMNVLTIESRNLLQLCQASLDMLETEVADRPRALEYVSRIQECHNRLMHLFEEVRQFAAPIHLECERYHMGSLLNQVFDDLSVRHPDRQIRLRETTGGLDLNCSVDPIRLYQAFRILLENSIHACSDPVQINALWSERIRNETSELVVALRDNGPGLSVDQKRKAFEPFFSTKKSGIGLGLSICRRIVEAHGGRIEIGTHALSGAEFVLSLPRNEVTAQPLHGTSITDLGVHPN